MTRTPSLNIGRLKTLLVRVVLFGLLGFTMACGGCEVDPTDFVDVKQFYPDMPDPRPDMDVEPDMGEPDLDSGRRPKDTNFQFDFGDPEDMAPEPFALTAIVPDTGPVPGGNQVRIQGTGLEEDSTVLLGGKEMEVELSTGTLVGRAPPGSGPGPVTVKVIAPDGEIRALVDAYTYVADLRIDEVSPTLVPTTGGVEVDIFGAGFEPQTGISFSGDSALRVTYVSPTHLRALVPPRPRGFADVRATTPSDSVEAEDAVRYFEPLRIDAVEPASGDVAGGDTVTIVGAGFTSDSTVRFAGSQAQVLSVDAQNGEIDVQTPAHAAGLVDVFVQNSIDAAVLVDGFYYRSSDTPALAAVNPNYGPVSGGNTVRVTGWGLDGAGIEIRFGGAAATIAQSAPSWADVVVPPGAEGAVDVAMFDGATELDRLPGAYTYVRDLEVTDVDPSSGPDTGGTVVTITGSGFTGTESVTIGGVPADFTVNDDGSIEVTTPAHVAGAVDVVVSRDGIDAVAEDGFTYEGTLEVWGFTPVRGAIAGGTYVEVRGRGFFGEIGVTLDGTDGTGVRRLDRNNLYFYTPPHAPGEADLEVTAMGQSAMAPYTYLYFDPASRFGGVSGGPVDGSVNVTVFASGGGPIENAFVMLSTRADTPYQGWTDANGQITLSGPDVLGAQTTTATAAGFSSATIDTVDAENVTLFLNTLDPGSGSGNIEPPPFGIIRGDIKATGKLADPDDSNTFDMAVVGTTQKTITGGNPPAGPNAIVLGEGQYEIRTRIGDMAVVGLCGSYHQPTDTFTPQFMAVERFVFISDQDELEIDLVCDIPLDQTHTYKLINAPYAPDGPNTNRVTVFWDFGFEGFFPSPTAGQGFESLVTVERQPPLEGEIADISFVAQGGAFTGFGAPFSRSTVRNVTDVASAVELPVLLDVPEAVSPQPGGTVQDGVIRFQASGPYYPDFYYLVLRNDMGIPVWSFILPGDTTDVKLPEFPDFSAQPPDQRPNPVPGSMLFMTIVAARTDGGHVYEQFTYRDIDTDVWEAYSLTSWALRLK